MPKIALPLTSEWYKSRSKAFTDEQCVNLYPEIKIEGDGKTKFMLVGTPGCKPFASLGLSAIRGLRNVNDELYAVSGETAYRFGSGGVANSLSGSVLGSGPVMMSHNATQVSICNGETVFVAEGGAVTEISDPDFPGASSFDYMDGYGIFTVPNSSQWGVTGLNDFTDVDALDFASAEKQSDKTVRVFSFYDTVLVFGTETTERWYNSGDVFPFSRISNGVLERGLGAKNSVAKLDNRVFWVDNNRQVVVLEGATPVRVSTHALEKLLEEAGPVVSEIEGYSYVQEGHSFYAINVPGFGSFAYDVATQQWHKRKSYGMDTSRINCYTYCYGKHLVGDSTTGNIYELDLDTYTENGGIIEREIVLPHLFAETNPFTVSSLHMDFDTGVGLTTGQGSNPQAALTVSKDGGNTYGTERTTTIGQIGQYGRDTKWTRLGQAKNQMSFKVKITDPVKTIIKGAHAMVEGGAKV